MQKEYDFSNAVRNPYAKNLKKQITINISIEVIDYFKELSKKCGIPYQNLIDMYLSNCAQNKKEIEISWK